MERHPISPADTRTGHRRNGQLAAVKLTWRGTRSVSRTGGRDTVVELWGDHFQLTEMSLPRSKPIFITSLSRSYVNRPPCDSNISPVSGSSGLITQPFPF